MKITKDQLELLLLEQEKIKMEYNRLKDSRAYEKPLAFGTNPSVSEYEIANTIINKDSRNREINMIISTSEIVANPNTRTIEIGSKAKIFLKFSDSSYDLFDITLIEKKVGQEPSIPINKEAIIYITKDSKLGKAINHKEIGTRFRYYENDGNLVKGTIVGLTFERPGIGKTYLKSNNTIYKD